MRSTFGKWFQRSLCAIGIIAAIAAPAYAQTGGGQPGGPSGGAPKTSAGEKPAKPAEVEIQSVGQAELRRHENRQVKVTGIVGDHDPKDEGLYRFHTNDGEDAWVQGAYPDVAQTSYTITAQVTKGPDGKYKLVEIKKERGSGGGSSKGPDPLLIAGGVLIVAAVVIVIAMAMRNKADRSRQEYEEQVESERRRADAARAEAEALRNRPAGRSGGPGSGGPGGTVVSGEKTGSAAPARPAHTIISMGHLEATGGPHAGIKFALTPGENRIGRAKDRDCGVLLDKDGEVSSYHGSLILTMDGRILFKDESSNGSVVDGKPVHYSQVEVNPGSILEIGGSTFKLTMRTTGDGSRPVDAVAGGQPVPVETAPASSAPASAATSGRRAQTVGVEMPAPRKPAAPTMAGYGAEIEVAQGPEAGQRFAITRVTTTLGREDRDILLSDESISRRHAVVSVRDKKIFLTDENSTHGTRVNGEAVDGAGRELADGDRITLGKGTTVLLFHQISQDG